MELTEKLKKQFQNYNQDELNNVFTETCKSGNLDVIQYLLTSPDLKTHADIFLLNDYGFVIASREGHLDIVRYLLTSPDLKELANIHAEDDLGFRWACENNHVDIAQYLLSYDGKQCIDFQQTQYNLDWAIKNQHDEVIVAMMGNLKNNHFMEYMECLPKIEAYNNERYEQVKNLALSGDEVKPQEMSLLF